MKIEIWSDIICPFCYIGKRNFEKGLKEFTDKDAIEVEWKSYLLDPSAPKTPNEKTYVQILADKYGWSLEKAQQNIDNMSNMARSAGLDYQLEHIQRINTVDLHKIIQYAKTKGLGDEMEEAFFKAYFVDALDLSQEQVLKEILRTIGLTKTDLEEALHNENYEKAMQADIAEAKQIGLQGVPFFVLNRKYAISGAQSPEGFLEAIETAYKEWSEKN